MMDDGIRTTPMILYSIECIVLLVDASHFVS